MLIDYAAAAPDALFACLPRLLARLWPRSAASVSPADAGPQRRFRRFYAVARQPRSLLALVP
eukprot:2336911-Pleurochrysis_carterae.AAC.4